MTRRVLFYVQHLLGVGHVRRAAVIVRAMAAAGHEVSVALGGLPVRNVDFGRARIVRLAPVRTAASSFDLLLDADGAPVDEAWRRRRKGQLLDVFEQTAPDVLMIELFPFGRRQFRFELLPLVEAAEGRACIVSSVRDVLVRKDDAAKNRDVVNTARRWFERIFVHGDPAVIPFTDTFPEAEALSDKLVYTGYVAEDAEPPDPAGAGDVVVSVGGGAIGADLLRTAIAARPLGRLATARWRLLAGDNLPDGVFEELQAGAPEGVAVERARPDFRRLLASARLSISQGGYNTVMDVLRSSCRSVVVPFAEAGESEQTHRALVFQNRGLMTVLDAGSLGPESLAAAADEAMNKPPPDPGQLDMNGADETARLIGEL